MARNKMKKYKFSDEVVAKDAIISVVFGVISFICIAYAVIYAFVVHGKAPEAVGAILLAGAVSDFTAIIFGLLAYKDPDGGILSKRTAMIVSIVDAVLLVAIYFI